MSPPRQSLITVACPTCKFAAVCRIVTISPHDDGSPRHEAVLVSFGCECPLDVPESANIARFEQLERAQRARWREYEAKALAKWEEARP